MHARKVPCEDGRCAVKLCWSHSELLLLTRSQHCIFGKLVELQAAEAGRDSLLRPGILDALFELASRPWWDAAAAGIEYEPDTESGPAA